MVTDVPELPEVGLTLVTVGVVCVIVKLDPGQLGLDTPPFCTVTAKTPGQIDGTGTLSVPPFTYVTPRAGIPEKNTWEDPSNP